MDGQTFTNGMQLHPSDAKLATLAEELGFTYLKTDAQTFINGRPLDPRHIASIKMFTLGSANPSMNRHGELLAKRRLLDLESRSLDGDAWDANREKVSACSAEIAEINRVNAEAKIELHYRQEQDHVVERRTQKQPKNELSGIQIQLASIRTGLKSVQDELCTTKVQLEESKVELCSIKGELDRQHDAAIAALGAHAGKLQEDVDGHKATSATLAQLQSTNVELAAKVENQKKQLESFKNESSQPLSVTEDKQSVSPVERIERETMIARLSLSVVLVLVGFLSHAIP